MTPRTVDRLRICLAVGLGGMTLLHVLRPEPFVEMVPTWLPGDRELLHGAATVAEGLSAALLSRRRTAGIGGWLAAATFVAVFPANIDAVLRGGYEAAPGLLSSRAAAIARLPLQLPLVAAAVTVARRA